MIKVVSTKFFRRSKVFIMFKNFRSLIKLVANNFFTRLIVANNNAFATFDLLKNSFNLMKFRRSNYYLNFWSPENGKIIWSPDKKTFDLLFWSPDPQSFFSNYDFVKIFFVSIVDVVDQNVVILVELKLKKKRLHKLRSNWIFIII